MREPRNVFYILVHRLKKSVRESQNTYENSLSKRITKNPQLMNYLPTSLIYYVHLRIHFTWKIIYNLEFRTE